MKHRLLIISLIAFLASLLPGHNANADNRGIPFIRNYYSTEYNAHNRSFDVACDDYGTVYFANFECLLYYDGATWRKIPGPNNNRFLRLVWDKRCKRIWTGGFNFFGYIEPDDRGILRLKLLHVPDLSKDFGEVDMIKLYGKDVFVHVLDGRVYRVLNPFSEKPTALKLYRGSTSFITTDMEKVALSYVSSLHMSYKYGYGLTVSDATRKRLINETDGICSNNINFVMYDRQHTMWGATDHGIFSIEIPSPYSHIESGQGLNGDVYSINSIGETIYVGTLQGIYRIDEGKVTHLPGLNMACWQLTKDGNSLLASTTTGLYRITSSRIKQIETEITYATIPAPRGGYYTAQNDSIYYVPNEDDAMHYTCMAHIEKATNLQIVGNHLLVETFNGQKWSVSLTPPYHPTCLRKRINLKVPKIEYLDVFDRRWRTNAVGDSLQVAGHAELTKWIHPLLSKKLNAIYCGKENSLWIGGDFGVINCDLGYITQMKKSANAEPVYIRQIVLGDSIIWGGYTKENYKPKIDISDIVLPANCHDLKIYFSSRYQSFLCPTKYRYRDNNGKWTSLGEQPFVLFHNLSYGDNTVEIEAIDLFGNTSHASVSFHVTWPFYLQWYAFLIYIIAIIGSVRWLIYYREAKLERDKAQLESIVNKRTAELSTTLDELQRTQADLVRMERTATAGKLTQGLIDRILNPINYINNFSKLTKGLAKDLGDDIEDEKENMSEDNYEDCEDVLDMMNQNLTKIEEHGINATRTLRAMEAMLNTKVGTMKPVDITSLLKQIYDVAADYYKEDIAKYKISFTKKIPNTSIIHDIDQESISNVIKAMLSNAIYAVIKKTQREPYDANVELRLASLGDNHIEIIVHDNGIGIEDSIKEKVFDPFFTTKTTGEAAGVGMYLAREIIQDHQGTISLESTKDEFTNFIISL